MGYADASWLAAQRRLWREGMTLLLNRLEMVTWDRCILRDDSPYATVYGWIARDDGRSDFAVVYFHCGKAVGMVTSSAKWSAEISARLFGGNSEGHRGCERVEDVLPLVQRKATCKPSICQGCGGSPGRCLCIPDESGSASTLPDAKHTHLSDCHGRWADDGGPVHHEE